MSDWFGSVGPLSLELEDPRDFDEESNFGVDFDVASTDKPASSGTDVSSHSALRSSTSAGQTGGGSQPPSRGGAPLAGKPGPSELSTIDEAAATSEKPSRARGESISERNDSTPGRPSANPNLIIFPRSDSLPGNHQQTQHSAASPVSQTVPTFREILAIKSPKERIKTFNDVRERFANMNPGLVEWLGYVSSPRHHDGHANGRASTEADTAWASITDPENANKGHIKSLSLTRFGLNNRRPLSGDGSTRNRPLSGGGEPAAAAPQITTPAYAADPAPLQPTHTFSTTDADSQGPRGSLAKSKDKGKEIGANMFHSAASGAKGLLAKGRNKLRNSSGQADKVT